MQVKPLYVSSVIQINTNGGFVSDSPYIHAFDGLGRVHHQMQEDGLAAALESINYCLEGRKEQALPNGKGFVQLDLGNQIPVELTVDTVPRSRYNNFS